MLFFKFFFQDEFDNNQKKFDIDGAYFPRILFMGLYKFYLAWENTKYRGFLLPPQSLTFSF